MRYCLDNIDFNYYRRNSPSDDILDSQIDAIAWNEYILELQGKKRLPDLLSRPTPVERLFKAIDSISNEFNSKKTKKFKINIKK